MDRIDEGLRWGMLLLFWLLLLGVGGIIAAGVRALHDRSWLRRLQNIERGREAQRNA